MCPGTVDTSSALKITGRSLDDIVSDVERAAIMNALKQADGVLTRASELLGTTRRILKYKMDKLGIAAPQDAAEPAPASSAPRTQL